MLNEIGERVEEGIGVALATAPQLGPQAVDIIDAARQAFIDGFRPALLVGAALGVAAATYTTLLGGTSSEDASSDPEDGPRERIRSRT